MCWVREKNWILEKVNPGAQECKTAALLCACVREEIGSSLCSVINKIPQPEQLRVDLLSPSLNLSLQMGSSLSSDALAFALSLVNITTRRKAVLKRRRKPKQLWMNLFCVCLWMVYTCNSTLVYLKKKKKIPIHEGVKNLANTSQNIQYLKIKLHIICRN